VVTSIGILTADVLVPALYIAELEDLTETYASSVQVMALPLMRNSSQDLVSCTLGPIPVVKYGKRHQEKLREVDLDTIVSKQRTGATETPATLGRDRVQYPHAATGSESRHILVGATDVLGAIAEAARTLDERMRPEAADKPLTCSICTEDFRESEDIRVLPCSHIYHKCCIDPWLLDFGGNCPLW
jgi:hypothetical protein